MAVRKPFRRAQRRGMEAAANLYATLVEALSGADTIKALGAERSIVERADDQLVPFLNAGFRTSYISIATSTLSALFTGLAMLVALWLGGHRVLAGDLSVGQLMAISALIVAMTGPLERLVNATQSIQDGAVTLDRLWEVLDLTTEESTRSRGEVLNHCRGAVALESVVFRYGTRTTVLDGISIAVQPGRTVAIVGPSGSGKSTVAKLIQGFYAPESGRVAIDGIDVRMLTPHSLRRQLGVVPQNPVLFSGTIAENIAFGCDGRPVLDRVIAAAERAGAHAFIQHLPEVYHTEIGEQGVQLSVGERQRLAIARALYRDAPILIFDEVTSALDAHAEEIIRETMRALHGTRTIVVIAHRLSTVMHADEIVVLSGGKIVECGSHNDLTARGGAYWEMWKRQTPAPPTSHAFAK